LSSKNHSILSECEVVLPDLLLLYGLQPRPVLLFSLLPPLLLNSPNIFISKIILTAYLLFTREDTLTGQKIEFGAQSTKLLRAE
jgi:hypothetical protein